MTLQGTFAKLTVAFALGVVAACGTAPSDYGNTEAGEDKTVAADGAASADPGYRVRGANGLLDLVF